MSQELMGEGSLSGIFPTPQSLISITFFGAQRKGNAYVELFKEDGSSIGIAKIKDILPKKPYYFQVPNKDIKGFSVYNDNKGGLGIWKVAYAYDPTDISISGFVFVDVDEDGLYNSETDTLYEGATVKLFDCYTGSSATNYLGSVVSDEVTDVNWEYTFSELLPGNYKVQFVVPSGYETTIQSQYEPLERSIDSDSDTNGYTPCFNITTNENSICAGIISIV